MFFDFYSSPLGQINLQSNDGKSLCALFFSDMNRLNFLLRNPLSLNFLKNSKNSENSAQQSGEIFAYTKNWLDIYFSGQKPDFTPKLDLKGSAFSISVYFKLLEIKYGTSTSYSALAKKLKINSARAVGKAVGANPVLLIIPCHRVLGADLSLRGYSAALWRKKELLKLEKIAFKE